jgi:hypothetical protein
MKIIPKNGTNCYLLKVWSKNEYFYDCNWLYLKLKPEDLIRLDYIKGLFKEGKDKAGNLYRISFLNNHGTAWLDDETLPADFVEMLGELDDDTLEIEPIEEIEDSTFHCIVEIEIMNIDEYGISFSCFLKDSDTELETQTLEI